MIMESAVLLHNDTALLLSNVQCLHLVEVVQQVLVVLVARSRGGGCSAMQSTDTSHRAAGVTCQRNVHGCHTR